MPEDRQNNFDLIRLWAASTVLLIHANAHLQLDTRAPILQGIFHILGFFPGVPIFFVISGFLISRSWEASKSAKSYATKRFLRIYPALVVCFGVSLLTMAAFGVVNRSSLGDHHFWAYLAAQLTMGQFYTPPALRSYGVGNPNGSLWTIPVEMQFYIVLPLIYLAVRKAKIKSLDAALVAMAAISILANVFLDRQHSLTLRDAFGVTFVPRIWMFCAGALIQRHMKEIGKWFEGKALYWIAGYIAFQLVAEHFIAPAVTLIPLAGVVVSVAFSARSLSSRILRGIDVSYGVYLYHMVVINALIQAGYGQAPWRLPATIAIAFAAATVSYLAIERPALKLRGKNTMDKRKEPAVAIIAATADGAIAATE